MGKTLKANFTLIKSFTLMNFFMLVQVNCLGESFAASLAFIRLLSSVDPHMPLEVMAFSERLRAKFANEGSFTRMNTFVFVQIRRLREGHAAGLTLVRPLSSVNPFVTLNIVRFVKPLITISAHIRSNI